MDGIDPSRPPHSPDTHQQSLEHQVDLPFDNQEQAPPFQPFPSGVQPLLLQQIPEPLNHAWPPPGTSAAIETPWMQTQYGTYPHTDDYLSEYISQQNPGQDSIHTRQLMYSPVETLSSSSFPSLSTHTSYSASPLTPDHHGGQRERNQQQQRQQQQQQQQQQQRQQQHQNHEHYQQPSNSQWATTDGDVSTSTRNRPIAPRRTSTTSVTTATSATSQESPSQPSLTKRPGKEGDREYRRVKAKRNRVKNKTREEQLLTLEEELKEQNEELCAQADDLKGEVLGLKKEILSHAWCDNELITQYINGQAANLSKGESSQVPTAESQHTNLDDAGQDGDAPGDLG